MNTQQLMIHLNWAQINGHKHLAEALLVLLKREQGKGAV